MLIKHERTQAIYLLNERTRTLTLDSKSYIVKSYIPIPNHESVLYLREPDDFIGFSGVDGAAVHSVSKAEQYQLIKFKLNGNWIQVPPTALSE